MIKNLKKEALEKIVNYEKSSKNKTITLSAHRFRPEFSQGPEIYFHPGFLRNILTSKDICGKGIDFILERQLYQELAKIYELVIAEQKKLLFNINNIGPRSTNEDIHQFCAPLYWPWEAKYKELKKLLQIDRNILSRERREIINGCLRKYRKPNPLKYPVSSSLEFVSIENLNLSTSKLREGMETKPVNFVQYYAIDFARFMQDSNYKCRKPRTNEFFKKIFHHNLESECTEPLRFYQFTPFDGEGSWRGDKH